MNMDKEIMADIIFSYLFLNQVLQQNVKTWLAVLSNFMYLVVLMVCLVFGLIDFLSEVTNKYKCTTEEMHQDRHFFTPEILSFSRYLNLSYHF